VSLPILTFDERVLSPRFGYVFQRRWMQPCESIVGTLWKFVRLNQLPGHSVVKHLCNRTVDPYEGIETFDISIPLVAQLLQITQKSVRAGVGSAGDAASSDLRFCPTCLNQGYHGRPHQLLRLVRCPIHDVPLQTSCRRCGRTSAYRLDAQLLDSPFRCRHCRGFHARSGIGPSPKRFALLPKERSAITRSVLS
jgi:hypothetical protein